MITTLRPSTTYRNYKDCIYLIKKATGASGGGAQRAIKAIRTGEDLTWTETGARHRCIQINTLAPIPSKLKKWATSLELKVTNVYYTAKEWPTPIHIDECSNARMGSNKPTFVIRAGEVMRYTGIGWSTMRDAVEEDYYNMPTVYGIFGCTD